jgi:cyclopropane-fatty-acyl-phospholipid synthase
MQQPNSELLPTRPWDRWFRQILLRKFGNLQSADLRMIDADGQYFLGAIGEGNQQGIEIRVVNPRFYRRVLTAGNLGAAEAWMDGDWTCNDLCGLIRLMTRNLKVADRLNAVWGRARNWWERVRHGLRGNSLKTSRKNIHAHYDLGNAMFSLFLDPTMNYSSAIFRDLPSDGPRESLHRAQLNKMEQICRTLNLQPDDHLLEIGSGWGSLACYAAKHFGCRVTTTTISREQYEWVRKKVELEGLEGKVELLDQDYRKLQGKYDKIVSVEMIEAVGDQYYPVFFEKCQQLLNNNGLLLLQAITIVDQRYKQHLRSVDFICKYIFPGGSLPCISRLVNVAAHSASLRLIQLNDFAPHYAETLRRWREKFWQNIGAIRELGYDEKFVQMWDYYLVYCEAGFDERQINVSHLLFASQKCHYDPDSSREFFRTDGNRKFLDLTEESGYASPPVLAENSIQQNSFSNGPRHPLSQKTDCRIESEAERMSR